LGKAVGLKTPAAHINVAISPWILAIVRRENTDIAVSQQVVATSAGVASPVSIVRLLKLFHLFLIVAAPVGRLIKVSMLFEWTIIQTCLCVPVAIMFRLDIEQGGLLQCP
jgi:hypothetical protein